MRCYDKGTMYVVDTSRARRACERSNDMLPCSHILYAHAKDLIRSVCFLVTIIIIDLFRYSNRWTKYYTIDLVFQTLDNISISAGSEDLLEKFTNNYHSIHTPGEPMVDKHIRS